MISKLIELNKQRPFTVFVVGDCMIDEYYQVHVSRISPEFPIQVLQSQTDQPICVPGGAGNVAEQFRHFLVDCHLFGLLDKQSHETYKRFSFKTHCVGLSDGFTPIKRRLYDGSYALTRWDIEKRNYGSSVIESERSQLLATFRMYVESVKPDVVVFSDYCKGLFTVEIAQEMIAVCRQHKVKTIVDPKDGLEKWKGCWLFKPNSKEAANLTGLSAIPEQLLYLKEALQCEYVVITNSGDGVYVLGKDDVKPRYKANYNIQVQSVIGAGDCFSAFLAMAQHYLGMDAAIEVAYNAGSVYVQNRYNQPISQHDLRRFVDPVKAKIVEVEDLPDLDGKNVVVTNGCYDILHDGHVNLFNHAKSKGDVLIVAVNDDNSVRRLKGNSRPINSVERRINIIANLQSVDFVLKFSENSPEELYRRLTAKIGRKFKFLVKGGDYSADQVIGKEFAEVVEICPLTSGQSTTGLIEKIKCTH